MADDTVTKLKIEDLCDALTVEILPALEAARWLARMSAALREVADVAESEPAFGRRLALGGVDLAELLGQPPEDDIAGLTYAIRLRLQELTDRASPPVTPTGDRGAETSTSRGIIAVAKRLNTTGGKNGANYKAAFEDGRTWAAETAEADELEALSTMDLDHIFAAGGGARRAAAHVADELGYDSEEALFGEIPWTLGYLRGFIDGAVEIYREALVVEG